MDKFPKLCDSGKVWYVYYYVLDPDSDKFVRFIKKTGLNSAGITLGERKRRAGVIISAITANLKVGVHPLDKAKIGIRSKSNKKLLYLIAQYLLIKKATTREQTYGGYKEYLNKLGRYLAPLKLDIDQVKKAHILEFMLQCKRPDGNAWSGKTYNNHLTAIRTFFTYYNTQYEDYIIRDPTIGLNTREETPVGNVPISDGDMIKAKTYLSGKYPEVWTFCMLIYYQALRPHTEARLLQRKHYDFTRNTITVPAHLSKNKKTQTIPFDPILKKILHYAEHEGPEYFIIGGEKPRTEEWLVEKFGLMKKEFNIGPLITMYSFKHLRALHLYEDTGGDIEFIRILFRHSTATTTLIYLRGLGLMTDGSKMIHSRVL